MKMYSDRGSERKTNVNIYIRPRQKCIVKNTLTQKSIKFIESPTSGLDEY